MSLSFSSARSRFFLRGRQVAICLAVCAGVFGCRENQSGFKLFRSDKTAESNTATDPALFTSSKQLMGTVFSVTISGIKGEKLEPVINSIYLEIDRLEKLVSDRIEQSEISRINASAGTNPVKISDDTLAVLRSGLEVSRWSEGAFDLSWAALRGLFSFDPESPRLPNLNQIKNRLPLIDYRDIIIDEAAQTAMLRRKGMRLGVGAIGKGYALDRASAILSRAGIDNFMLFAGGQVQVKGRRGKRLWRVGIRHPRRNDYFGVLKLPAGAVSTSGDYEHSFFKHGRRWHHILDPKTGLPVEHTVSVTVVSPKGVYADALSTAIFALGPERAFELLSSAPGNPEIIILDKDLKVFQSAGLAKIFTLETALVGGRLPL
ncbi:MAG: FAD:protein FMN transferase [Deltaproteobacteria bacterium]|nr:FAD:protein FMN transferase [Deltaproteobacteria bacterium]